MKRLLDASGENRLVGFMVIVTLAIGLAGIFATPFIMAQDRSGDTVESYTATLHFDGTLDETYVYKIVSKDTRFLFRFWEVPVTTSSVPLTSSWEHLEVLSITPPLGTTAYIKDYRSLVIIYSGSYDNKINDLAYANEVGAFNPNYYQPGTYTVTYSYKVFFPVESDGSVDHLNLMLARTHITYSNVRIILEGADKIKTLYAHPPSLQVSRVDNNFVVAGSSGENELLEVEMLANTASSPWRAWAAITPDNGVESLTASANRDYSTRYWAAFSVNLGGKLAVILMPLLLLGLWLRFGHEPDVTVPTYLSTVPNPDRKPSLVNLAFKGAVDDLDENGFYATLLDLHRRKKIIVETRPSGVKITILDRSVEDAYEQSVLEFLSKFSTVNPTPKNPVAAFDTDTLKELASKVSSGSSDGNALEAQRLLLRLMSARVTSSGGKPLNLPLREILLFIVSLVAGNFIGMYIWGIPFPISIIFGSFAGVWGYGFIGGIARAVFSLTLGSSVQTVEADEKWGWNDVINSLFEKGKNRVVKLFAIPAILLVASLIVGILAPLESYLAGATLVLALAAFAQIVYAYSQPDTLFGRWKDGYYKEKLEWDAFRNHLSDLSQMSKYSPEDLSMWGSWLVYGTTLGVGDKVAQAMSSLNIKIDVAPMVTMAHTHFHPIIVARAPVTYSSGGGRGGGHGGGGGHSGGGGGHGGGGGGRR